jgi:hypothetical protein
MCTFIASYKSTHGHTNGLPCNAYKTAHGVKMCCGWCCHTITQQEFDFALSIGWLTRTDGKPASFA